MEATVSETLLLRLNDGPHPGTRTVDSAFMPWPLPESLDDDGGQYVKVSESQLPEGVPGVLRGAEYDWEAE